MRDSYSRQYDLPCIIAETGDTAPRIIDACHEIGAVRRIDGIEYVVRLREDVGPELWTEEALRLSLATEEPR